MITNPVPWPNGAKCAVAITFDMDTDSILHLAHPDTADTRISTMSWLKYDEVAVPRILAMYKRHELKQTFFIPAWCIERYPKTVELILNDGHEIAHHGYLHEHPNELSAEEELGFLHRGIEIIEKFTGQRPRGWRAPMYNFSKHSADFLAQEGFLYDSSLMGDDIPYVLKGKSGEIIELPTHWALDDWPQYTHNGELGYVMPINSPNRAMEVFLSEFDAAWKYGGMWISVWHPFVSGRLARCSKIDEMIDYMKDKGDVWFATLEEIAMHVRKCINDGSYTPRVDQLPYYEGRIPELPFNLNQH
ncbi:MULTISPECIES: polysaccharide deacetylase [unclassified Paenibacillus]|uniref:polysaccharide deacetylase family protein n=1 Tax=unclassified Paenibacillus TaxID=185978 RepID=UPI002406EAA2|nr:MULTISPECIES: polysaccharide deacetylase [unclassified Paenibacillus]MDF9845370.1 peptidoglycan/xylan/chitin deacetylase (PgdA/CDA1 family) [Paenibacillus sp. PastF-2]MDF9851944.1 peptidoglycan/xylan/chitin deacetylase (PgdA/CDA1 family) [Paenibacillus sp. PastM-2]MDF9858508.1 peptidoglycan/xylan/chitin deacetylase (PgdA/CDA1 family) [Paenibacillus sp. PastF-1]MDH6483783.1 peptidoglycan/xylan/chitin deacetylase (PgdA/CDA1 family) [Paenibacillus sp. PastH-2]MDH6511156.1 peptidoglycan/xylan/c